MKDLERIINSVAIQLSKKYKIPSFDIDDFKQEITIEWLKKKDQFNEELSDLYNFIFLISKNHIFNLYRLLVERLEKPCSCPDRDDNEDCCPQRAKWRRRNEMKRNVASPINIGIIDDTKEKNTREDSNLLAGLIKKEMAEIIDAELPVEFRKDYIIFINGGKLNKHREKELLKTIRNIFVGKGYTS